MPRSLIVVTTRFPWPLTNGFANKNYWLIRGLAKDFDIDLFVIQHKVVDEYQLSKISPYCKSIKVYKPTVLDLIKGAINSILLDLPMQIGFFRSAAASRDISASLPNCSAVLCSVIRGAQYIKSFSGPKFFDLADSLGQLYLRDAKKFAGAKSMAYREEGRRMLKYESKTILSGTHTFFFNKQEATHYDSRFVSVVPHGVDSRLFQVDSLDSQCKDGVVIFGKMDFAPNVQAVHWFEENVLRLLPNHIRVYVIGVSPHSSILKLANTNPRIKVLGYVQNPYPMIRGAIASLCPVQIGGGVQNKVIESLAVGALTLISPLAAIPMEDIHNSGVFVCNSPSEWADEIIKVAKQPEIYKDRRLMGRAYAKAHFSWDAYVLSIKEKILNAIS